VPSSGSSVKAGRVAVAGWRGRSTRGSRPSRSASAAARGMRRPGDRARHRHLAPVVWQWDATAGGPYLIEARATDKTGYTQTSVTENVAPNGATGYPSATVTVT